MTPASEPETLEERVARALAKNEPSLWFRPLYMDAARAAIAVVVEEAAAIATNWAAEITTAESSLGHYRIAGSRIAAAIRDLSRPGEQG